jgi:TctA family transporter
VLQSIDTALAGAAVLALAMLTATASFHYGALRVIERAVAGHRVTRHWVVLVLAALVGAHLVEIALYAGAFAIGANVLDLGALHGSRRQRPRLLLLRRRDVFDARIR